jgi:hypothetical protein
MCVCVCVVFCVCFVFLDNLLSFVLQFAFFQCEEKRRKHKLTLLDVSEIGSGLEILAGVKF